ncbi:hypothetical protein VTK73DRAFT_4010 [Phialemonium thermophilum]|uniref:Homeobox domain-containing protein n=1 Tax=Phialemonium thermophilum TaxID=223376 RepID=A0ABR3WW66_9PEZI
MTEHLHHPYPTDEQKQELMRKTGLQMNQIANWFINCRRRQMPSLRERAQETQRPRSSGAIHHHDERNH